MQNLFFLKLPSICAINQLNRQQKENQDMIDSLDLNI